MTTFYKYTTQFQPNFFDKPTVKLSSPLFLNDPFESEIGENLLRLIEEHAIEINSTIRMDAISFALKSELYHHGIVSLSETPRNSLMWAHYGEQHNGLCIGYDEDLFCKVNIEPDNISSIAEPKPKKINYDNYRYDRQNKIKRGSDIPAALKNHLFTKSDEWIYEKEHRCIIPLEEASSFLTISKDMEKPSSIMGVPEIGYILNDLLSRGSINAIRENEYSITKHLIDQEEMKLLASFPCVCFLYEVDKKHIKNIHIGHRASREYTKKIYEKIKSKDSGLDHVNLFKFKLSPKRFELLIDEVDKDFFKKRKRHTI